jgi:hypothetical protein
MQPDRPNLVWSLDFMEDSLWDGKKFRILNVLDDYNREGFDSFPFGFKPDVFNSVMDDVFHFQMSYIRPVHTHCIE